MGFRLDWKGDVVKRQIREAARAAIDDCTAAAVLVAQDRAPRDTGFMANTIEFEPAQEEDGRIVGRFGNWTADYTLWVEMGTSRMAAQPFLRPAASSEFPKLPERLRAHF